MSQKAGNMSGTYNLSCSPSDQLQPGSRLSEVWRYPKFSISGKEPGEVGDAHSRMAEDPGLGTILLVWGTAMRDTGLTQTPFTSHCNLGSR